MWLYDLPTLTQDRNISLSSDGEMKFINLPARLCFSMETVHKVPPPPTEKHREGRRSVTRDLTRDRLPPAHSPSPLVTGGKVQI